MEKISQSQITKKHNNAQTQGLYSLSCRTSYRKISWSLEAARFGFKLFQLLWNLTGTSAAALPRCLSNFRVIRPLQRPIFSLWDFTRFGGKTSYRLVNRGPEYNSWHVLYLWPSLLICLACIDIQYCSDKALSLGCSNSILVVWCLS